jgi:hypothetical protein
MEPPGHAGKRFGNRGSPANCGKLGLIVGVSSGNLGIVIWLIGEKPQGKLVEDWLGGGRRSGGFCVGRPKTNRGF